MNMTELASWSVGCSRTGHPNDSFIAVRVGDAGILVSADEARHMATLLLLCARRIEDALEDQEDQE
ncbi:MAG: hypothetical protein QM586_11675 [Xenophilus sp.]